MRIILSCFLLSLSLPLQSFGSQCELTQVEDNHVRIEGKERKFDIVGHSEVDYRISHWVLKQIHQSAVLSHCVAAAAVFREYVEDVTWGNRADQRLVGIYDSYRYISSFPILHTDIFIDKSYGGVRDMYFEIAAGCTTLSEAVKLFGSVFPLDGLAAYFPEVKTLGLYDAELFVAKQRLLDSIALTNRLETRLEIFPSDTKRYFAAFKKTFERERAVSTFYRNLMVDSARDDMGLGATGIEFEIFQFEHLFGIELERVRRLALSLWSSDEAHVVMLTEQKNLKLLSEGVLKNCSEASEEKVLR